MERENRNDREEFDPSQSAEFLKNLEKVFEAETKEAQKLTIEESKPAWIEIIEKKEEQEPVDEAAAVKEPVPDPDPEDEILTSDRLFPVEEEFRVDVSGIDEFESELSFTTEKEQSLEPETVPSQKKASGEEEQILQEITQSLAETAGAELLPPKETNEEELPKEAVSPEKKKLPKFVIPLAAVAGSLLLLCIFLFGTKAGQRLIINLAARYAESRMNYDDGSDHKMEDIEDDVDITDADLTQIPDLTVIPEESIDLGANEGAVRKEDDVINILLLGEEAIGSGSARGRTDVIMIATMNRREKSYKLTSLMRDLLVEIPGHSDNKLNAAYQIGGIPLLYETIEHNFDLEVDGYCLVGFDDFEAIIDLIDGIDITLTPSEASYLNRTNYISNPAYRTVKAGVNHMNGNQALGYCRIRYVGTGKEANDFGRTSRHRIVLNAVFEKVKSMNYFSMLRLVNSCLPFVTTDMKSGQITDYVEEALEIGLTEMESYRVPAEGTYEAGYVRKMAVLVPNLPENVALLHEFIFGEETKEEQ